MQVIHTVKVMNDLQFHEYQRLIVPMSEHTLQHLSDKLDQLITQCEKLQGDNALLRQREQEWLVERVDLVEKNNQARARVEAVIDNLKSLKEGVA